MMRDRNSPIGGNIETSISEKTFLFRNIIFALRIPPKNAMRLMRH
jgi:hypothetical protein